MRKEGEIFEKDGQTFIWCNGRRYKYQKLDQSTKKLKKEGRSIALEGIGKQPKTPKNISWEKSKYFFS